MRNFYTTGKSLLNGDSVVQKFSSTGNPLLSLTVNNLGDFGDIKLNQSLGIAAIGTKSSGIVLTVDTGLTAMQDAFVASNGFFEGSTFVSFDFSPVPEPGTLLLGRVAGICIAGLRRTRSRL